MDEVARSVAANRLSHGHFHHLSRIAILFLHILNNTAIDDFFEDILSEHLALQVVSSGFSVFY